jgi:DNA-binding MarR family transcriptional regulator
VTDSLTRATDAATWAVADAATGSDVDLIDAVLDLIHTFATIKVRLAAVRDGDQSPVQALGKLIAGGPARSGELASRMCADPSTVSRQVAALVRTGLVQRQADPDDGRASVLAPTEAGLARFAEHRSRRAQAMAPAVADWSDEDRATFAQLLRRFVGGVSEHREEIIATFAADHHREARLSTEEAGTSR